MRQARTPLACLPCDLETRSQQSLLTERSQFVQLLEAKGLLHSEVYSKTRSWFRSEVSECPVQNKSLWLFPPG